MKHAKKILALVLCLVLTAGLAVGAYADYEEILYPKPRWSYVSVVSGGVERTNLGGSIVLYDSSKYATLTITLQKYSGGWQDTNTSTSGKGYGGAGASTSLSLSSGSYRAKIVFRVYTTKDGAYLEGDTVYSSEYLV